MNTFLQKLGLRKGLRKNCYPLCSTGQVMIITTLAIGGTILGAATIAGLLMVYQIRQSTDLADSARAVFAADAGIEWQLYNFFKPIPLSQPAFTPALRNIRLSVVCIDDLGAVMPNCGTSGNSSATLIKSVGTSGNSSRAFIQFIQSVTSTSP